MAVSEFDAFGPWIYPVDAEHGVPPLFRPFFREEEPRELCIKLPRNIERRRAAPDMDLYDDLLCAYPDRVLLLHRDGTEVRRTVVPYRSICRIDLSRKLLQGRLTLYLADRSVSVVFNAVSMELMRAFVRLLRGHAAGDGDGRTASFRTAAVTDILLQNLLEDLRSEGESFAVGAFQEQAPLVPLDRSVRGRLRRALLRPMMPALAVLAGDGEVLLLRRETDPRRESGSGLGYTLTALPLRQVRGLRLEADPEYDARRLTMALSRGEAVCRFARENATVNGCFAGLRALL